MHIKDNEFIRGEVPMTKGEVRLISIGKLKLKKDSILIDVGAGTGSIGIEASTYLEEGKVFAIEKKESAIQIIKKNIAKFSVKNLALIKGNAPEDLNIKKFDRMFVGGSSKNIRKIINYFLKYSIQEGILVLNVLTLETLSEVFQILKESKNLFKDIEIINVNISRNKFVGDYTLMTSENPVYIISAIKK